MGKDSIGRGILSLYCSAGFLTFHREGYVSEAETKARSLFVITSPTSPEELILAMANFTVTHLKDHHTALESI